MEMIHSPILMSPKPEDEVIASARGESSDDGEAETVLDESMASWMKTDITKSP